VLELGAFYGYSTVVMASVAELVYSIDWHMGDEHAGLYETWDGYKANLIGYRVADRVVAIRGRFEDEVPLLRDRGVVVDGAFLDGHHSEESVSRDLDLALMLVKPGGFVAFHDYGRCEATGHAGFRITEVADRFGVAGVTGTLAWGRVPD
jgi:predicted O-methyltransferase YrrM